MSTSSYRYGRVPEDLLDSGASDRACRLHALLTRYGDRQPDYDPPRTELAERLRCSLDSLDRALRELVDGGCLVIEERSGGGVRLPNHYVLTEGGSRTHAEGVAAPMRPPAPAETPETAGDGGRTHAARGSRTGAAPIKASERRENLEEELPPSVVAPNGARSNGEVVQLRSPQAVVAVNGLLDQLKAELQAGRRSWDLSAAAKQQWERLLDSTGANIGPAQQFLMWYLAEMRSVPVEELPAHDWAMAGQKLKRWRGLALFGVDQAASRGLEGQAMWNYVEAVCKGTHAQIATGGTG